MIWNRLRWNATLCFRNISSLLTHFKLSHFDNVWTYISSATFYFLGRGWWEPLNSSQVNPPETRGGCSELWESTQKKKWNPFFFFFFFLSLLMFQGPQRCWGVVPTEESVVICAKNVIIRIMRIVSMTTVKVRVQLNVRSFYTVTSHTTWIATFNEWHLNETSGESFPGPIAAKPIDFSDSHFHFE